MNRRFPIDCPSECKYREVYDLSIDDLVSICNKMHKQIDDMDAYGPFYVPLLCPLSDEEFKEACKK